MLDLHSINIFLDETLVDELWTLAKRDGMLVEKVREASTKVAAKASGKLGKLWEWLIADVEIELAAEAAGKYSQKLQFSSVFRALILPEILTEITRIRNAESSLEVLQPGDFIQIEADTLELVPLPTFAGFIRQMVISGAGAAKEEQGNGTDWDAAVPFAEKLTATQRAFTFYSRATGEDEYESLIKRFYDEESSEVFNALCMSNDDHVLAVSRLSTDETVILFSVVEERYLRRNLAVFSVGRKVRVFGRIASTKDSRRGGHLIGIQAVSINLS